MTTVFELQEQLVDHANSMGLFSSRANATQAGQDLMVGHPNKEMVIAEIMLDKPDADYVSLQKVERQ